MNDDGDYEIRESFSNTVTSINYFYWLDISNCESLTCLPAELLNLKFLRRLSLDGCLKLEELPEIKETMENLKVLILNRTAIKELPSSLHRLVGLVKLSLKSCTKLKTIPSSIGNLSLLSHLDCSGCCRLTEIPNNIGCLSSLTELSLEGSSILNLPESMAHLSSLRSLNLNGCKLLECVPKLPPNLTKVQSFNCPAFKRMVLNSRLGRLMSDSKEGTYVFGLTNSQELDATARKNVVGEARIKITDGYRSVFFCFPRSTVPRWIHYCCQEDSPNLCSQNRLIGFALCAIMDGMRTNFGFRYNFRFISDGEIYSYNHFMPADILYRNSSRLFLWKHQLDLEAIGNKLFHAQNFTFQFQSDFKVKELGMCPMYTKSIEEASGSNAAE
ncbi:Disease resistance protein (TIR-NBS-LRR class) family [Trifolium repens]|nr:Disease resistance protein (TIR-NBS-LRR class) family [Trifolium repens]